MSDVGIKATIAQAVGASAFFKNFKTTDTAPREAEERSRARSEKQRASERARARPPTTQTNVRVEHDVLALWEQLCKADDMTKTDVLHDAIRALAISRGIINA
jgi:uncharacterized protein (DUF4415 family)